MKLLIIGVLFSLVAVIAMFIIPTLATHGSKSKKGFLHSLKKSLSTGAVGEVEPYLQVVDDGIVYIDEDVNTLVSFGFGYPSVYLNGIKILPESGKWYYELELLVGMKPGIGFAGAIGWVDEEFSCGQMQTNDSGCASYGVGDDAHSFAYDLHARGTYNGIATLKNYGPTIDKHQWKIGDRIGCYLDMDTHEIEFRINGEDWGSAFEKVEISGAIYPAVSLGDNQKFQLHFSTHEWEYTPGGYKSVLDAAVAVDLCGNFTPNNGELGLCWKCVNGNDRLIVGTNHCAYVKEGDRSVCVHQTRLHTKGKPDIAVDDDGCAANFDDGLIRFKDEDYMLNEGVAIPDNYKDPITKHLMSYPVYFQQTNKEKLSKKLFKKFFKKLEARFDREKLLNKWYEEGQAYNPLTNEVYLVEASRFKCMLNNKFFGKDETNKMIFPEEQFLASDDDLTEKIENWMKKNAIRYNNGLPSAPLYEEEEIDLNASVEDLHSPPHPYAPRYIEE